MEENTEMGETASQNSGFREHSRILPENAAGEALELVSEQKGVKQAFGVRTA